MVKTGNSGRRRGRLRDMEIEIAWQDEVRVKLGTIELNEKKM